MNNNYSMFSADQLSDSSFDFTRAILVDVSAFCENPFLTGIQRQLEALINNERAAELIPFCVENSKQIRILPRRFFDLINTFFGTKDDNLGELRVRYHGSHRGRNSFYPITREYGAQYGVLVDADLAFNAVGAMLNTEYVLDERRLDFYVSFIPKYNYKFFFIEHDLVFWTLKRHFAGFREHLGHIKHLRLMRLASNVGAVAREVAADLKNVARRDPSKAIAIITPGGSSLGVHRDSPVPKRLRVAVVGTIEPRKRSGIVLDTLEKLQEELGLEAVFCGTISGLCSPVLAKRFEALEDPFAPVRLLRAPTDEQIRAEVLRSTVTVYLSDGEGFGVPPLESLALGVPVIATEDVPSLGVIADHGIVKLKTNDSTSLTAALRAFADLQYAKKMRVAASTQKIPSWSDYAQAVYDWIDKVHAANRVTFNAQRNRARELEFMDCVVDLLPRQESPHSTDASNVAARLGLPPLRKGSKANLDDTFSGRCRSLYHVLAELYCLLSLYQAPSDDGIRKYARIFLKRAGSNDDYWAWRRAWPRKKNEFAALIEFYCSDEAISKSHPRNDKVTEVIRDAEPILSLYHDDDLSPEEFVLEACQRIGSSSPSERDFHFYVDEIIRRGMDARRDFIRALLSSDGAFGHFQRRSELWAFLLAAVGVKTPLWELAKYSARLVPGSVPYDTTPPFETWVRAAQLSPADIAEIALKLAAGDSVEWLGAMSLGAMARREGESVVGVAGHAGHIVYGPYFRLQPGQYSARITFSPLNQASAGKSHKCVIEAGLSEPATILSQKDVRIGSVGEVAETITFALGGKERRPIELRVWNDGSHDVRVSSIKVERIN